MILLISFSNAIQSRTHGVSADAIASYLSLPLNPTLVHLLRSNPRISYDPSTELYEFRPLHNIRSGPALLAYLKVSHGYNVKELKDGWPDCIATINELEKENKVLVIRGKKDGVPRTVWYNEQEIDVHVDEEFKSEWHRIVVPPPAELPKRLADAGLKANSVDPATVIKRPGGNGNDAGRRKKRRGGRGKVTNTHLNILRDYGDQ